MIEKTNKNHQIPSQSLVCFPNDQFKNYIGQKDSLWPNYQEFYGQKDKKITQHINDFFKIKDIPPPPMKYNLHKTKF
jgi:hypothetical protein